MSTVGDPPDDVPRRNGELVFDAPWQSRAFGLAAAYLEASGQGWPAFRAHLVAAIADLPDDTPYYDAWVVALDRLIAEDIAGDIADDRGAARPAPGTRSAVGPPS